MRAPVVAEIERAPCLPVVVGTSDGLEVGGIKLVRAEAVPEEHVEWLVPGFVARSELIDLSGDPGVGKGCITASWAAGVTNTSDDAGVILFQTEDRTGHVMARLRAEGADLSRVYLLDSREANTAPILPGDIERVEALVRKTKAALLVFDPALEFMAADLDSHKQQDVQRFAAALAGVAHRTRAAVVTVRHMSKAQGVAAIYRGAGSIAFVARARMALLAAKDKECGGRVLTVVKGNIGKDSHSVTFDIREKDDSTIVAWGAPTTVTADQLVNQDPKRRGPKPERAEAARDFLADLLTDGPVVKQEALRRGKTAGLGRTALYEAAKHLGLASVTKDLKPAWRLP